MTYAIRDVQQVANQLKAQGHDILYFNIGDPNKFDFDVPKPMRDRLAEVANQGSGYYSESVGDAYVRERIAWYEDAKYSNGVQPSDVIFTNGVSEGILYLFLSFLNPGDRVLVPGPTYPAYQSAGTVTQAETVAYRCIEEEGWIPDIDDLRSKINERTKLIVVINPNNPTGAVYSESVLRKLIDLAGEHDLAIVADEIYDNFVDGAGFRSVLQDPAWRDTVVYINGLSKTFAMTGWRLGYLVARREIMGKMAELAVNIYSCATSFAQKAIVAAYKGPWKPVREMVEIFKRRRDMLHDRLSRIPGFEVWKPLGAFYMFPRVKKLLDEAGMTSKDLATKLLEEYGVVVLPGTAFPDKAGEGFLRFSYASSFEDIEEGTRRIARAVEDILSSAKK